MIQAEVDLIPGDKVALVREERNLLSRSWLSSASPDSLSFSPVGIHHSRQAGISKREMRK